MFIYVSGTAFLMLNKKGLDTMSWIIYAILALVFLGIGLYILTHGGTFTASGYNKLEQQSQIQSCRAQGAISPTPFDNDFGNNQGDLFPDSCDVCLGGDDAKDSDADGIPDACDPSSNPPPKKPKPRDICKGTWYPEKGQCVLQCYTTYMTGKSSTPCQRA